MKRDTCTESSNNYRLHYMQKHMCIEMHGNTVHALITALLHSHNPRLAGPLCYGGGFTSLFASPWLLWFPIRTASPLIGLPDVRRRFTLVMYWSGPGGCACVYRCVCVCLYGLFFCPLCLYLLLCVCLYLCVKKVEYFFFIVCQQTLLAPAHAPGCKHCYWTAKQ